MKGLYLTRRGRVVVQLGLIPVAFVSLSLLMGRTTAAFVIAVVAIHEYGHLLAAKAVGFNTRGIYFIPFLGAATVYERADKPPNAHVFVALMGPVAGLIGSAGIFVGFIVTRNAQIGRGAALGAAINLFNLAPFNFLDGGRIVGHLPWSKSRYRRFFIVGSVLLLVGFIPLLAWGDGMMAVLFVLLGALGIFAASGYERQPKAEVRQSRSGWLLGGYAVTSLAAILLAAVPLRSPEVMNLVYPWVPSYLFHHKLVTWDFDVSRIYGDGYYEKSWIDFVGGQKVGALYDAQFDNEEITPVFDSKRGWRSAGIKFDWVGDLEVRTNHYHLKPVITIRFDYPDRMGKGCEGSYACTTARDEDCTIDLSLKALADQWMDQGHKKTHLLEHVVSQSLGYCWGLVDGKTGIMGPDYQVAYPSPSEIKTLKERIAQG